MRRRGILKISPKQGWGGEGKINHFLLKDSLTASQCDRYYNNTPMLSTNQRHLLLSVYNMRHDLEDLVFQYMFTSHLSAPMSERHKLLEKACPRTGNESRSKVPMPLTNAKTYLVTEKTKARVISSQLSGQQLNGNQGIKMLTIQRTTERLFHTTHHFSC